MHRKAKRSKKPDLEGQFAKRLEADDFPPFEREHRFNKRRAWRFDFAWPVCMVAVEIEGGTRNGGRHVRPDGFEKDAEKYNRAALDGWVVLRFTGRQSRSEYALDTLAEALDGRRQQ
jgi:very-short-patch-repair endonuclease